MEAFMKAIAAMLTKEQIAELIKTNADLIATIIAEALKAKQ